MMQKKINILLGSKHVDMFIKTNQNVSLMLGDSINTVVWSDGSLSDEDCENILADSKNISFADYKAAESNALEKLKNRPYCRKLRDKFVLARRLFDMPLAEEGRFVSLDSDVVFKRPVNFSKLWKSTDYPFISLRDHQNALSFYPRVVWRIARETNKKLYPVEQSNMGMIAFDSEKLDLDYFEYMFSNKDFNHAVENKNAGFWWLEQTAYSYFGRRLGAYHWSEKEAAVLDDKTTSYEALCSYDCVHLTGQNKRYLDDFLQFAKENGSGLPALEMNLLKTADYPMMRCLLWQARKKFFNK